MPLSPDVTVLVEELIRANFAWLAAEIIEAVELPQPIHVTSGDVSDHPQLLDYQVGLEAQWDSLLQSGKREFFSDLERTPELTDAEQLALATEIARLRLVEPVRRLAEAERIAGQMAVAGTVRGEEQTEIFDIRSKAVAFGFSGPDGTIPFDPDGLQVVNKLAKLLDEIAGFRPRSSTFENEA